MNFVYKDKLNGVLSISQSNKWSVQNALTPLGTYNIVLNFGSEIEIEFDMNRVVIPQNGLCFLNPGTFISSVNANDNEHYFIEFNAAFYCLELHDKEVSCNGLLFGASPSIPILICSFDEAIENRGILNMMIKEFEHTDSTQGDMLRLLLKRLIIICVRIGRSQLFKEAEPLIEDTDIVRNFQALVEKHFREKHKVSDYADLMFKSPKTLSNTFKKLGSSTPLQIIQERIVLEAKRLMRFSNKNVTEITYELGFSEPAQFSRLFKKIEGVSPSGF